MRAYLYLSIIIMFMGCNTQSESEETLFCILNSDCASGLTCSEGLCVKVRQTRQMCNEDLCCFTNEVCGVGFACALEINQCFEIECTTSVECEVDYICEDSRCLIDTHADLDRDGVPSAVDNCPMMINPDQDDLDGDGQGNLCDEDLDGDGIPNDIDLCSGTANEDLLGEDCLGDLDGDEVPEEVDNCPDVINQSQSDLDLDDLGNPCDDDLDGDGVVNQIDNCPTVPNANQDDLDGDGVGDVCASLVLWQCGDCGVVSVSSEGVECRQSRCWNTEIQECREGSWVTVKECRQIFS